METLIHALEDVSDPSSLSYGKHWIKSQVVDLTANKEGYNALINYLHSKSDIVIGRQTLYGEYIFAKAPVHVWEDVFATTFHTYEVIPDGSKNEGLKQIIRCEEYSLPVELDGHVSTVLNTVQFHGANVVQNTYNRDSNIPATFSKQRKSFERSYLPPEEFSPVDSVIESQVKSKPTATTNALFSSQAQTPTRQPTNTRQPTPTAQPSSLYAVGYVTPKFINRYYNVSSNTGTLQVSQAVYETNYEGYSPSDLTMFQNTFGLPLQSPIELSSFFKYHNCTYRDCFQGNLDLQYIMGIAQNVDTTYYYSPIDQYDFLSNWITSVSNTATPANVYSIGWSTDELYVSKSFMNLFNTEAIKLGVMGTTILACSGIDGALSNYARRGSSYCGYVPGFPASSPYVVAVGGTNGPQSNQPEVACQSGIWSNSSLITSGGGFSNVYSQPSWQAPAVKDYLNLVTGTSKQPSTSYKPSRGINVGSFNAIGRAYPDVALLAENYKVVVNGRIEHLDGTSASVVVMAAFVSLVNAQRKSKGMSTM
eukprot:gene30826-40129_t